MSLLFSFRISAFKVELRTITSVNTQKNYLVVSHPSNINNKANKDKIGVKDIIVPCECGTNKFPDHMIILTDQSIKNRDELALRETNDDVMLPYTPRIKRKLMTRRKKRCNKRQPLLTEQGLDSIYDFILFKIKKEGSSQF